jgi:hypothetical protein
MTQPITIPIIRPVDQAIQDPPELVAAIRARRGGALLKLDRMLLHSAPLYVKNGGSLAQAEALKDLAQPGFKEDLYPELEQAVIALAREMTLRIRVDEHLKVGGSMVQGLQLIK